jgi:hypothetical protein
VFVPQAKESAKAMKIDIKIDTKQLEARTLRESKRLAYSATQALNTTALKIQQAERANLDKRFTVRKAGFMYRLIKIDFASVYGDRAYVEVYIDNTKARVLLGAFEHGGIKASAFGANVAVPVTGSVTRPSFGSPVPEEYTFQALRFERIDLSKAGQAAHAAKRRVGVRGRLTGDYYIWAGNKRTFILPGVGVFQRTGPGKSDINLIYTFKKSVKLKDMLGFVETAQKVFAEEFNKAFNTAFESKK